MKTCPRCDIEYSAGGHSPDSVSCLKRQLTNARAQLESAQSWRDEMWATHTRIVKPGMASGSEEDRRFLMLGLCGEVGELANLLKKRWRATMDGGTPVPDKMVEEEFADCRAYLYLLGRALNINEEVAMHQYVIPKIRKRWPKK